jgi:hypothetical protein
MIRAFKGSGAELVAADERGVRADAGQVGLQAHAAETPLVAQGQQPAVLEADREAVPLRAVRPHQAVPRGDVVDDDAARHPEVDAEVGPLAAVGLAPHRLAAPQRGRERPAGDGVADLTRRVGAAHPGVRVVDLGDRPPERPRLHERPRTLDLGELRHTLNVV